MEPRRAWSREELLIAFNFYCRTPFGKLHDRNPELIRVAKAIGRSPGALGMKCCNFASLDPVHQSRGVAGLQNASRADRAIWDEFHSDWTQLALESEEAFSNIVQPDESSSETDQERTVLDEELVLPSGPTTTERTVQVRRVQAFFRRTVTAAYEFRCAMCGLAVRQLVIASHIIPWSQNESRRADPTNGLCLCTLHDKAFDRGLLRILPDTLVIRLGPDLKEADDPPELHRVAFLALEGERLRLPHRFAPDPAAIRSLANRAG